MDRPSTRSPRRRRNSPRAAGVVIAAVLAVTSLASCKADQVGTAAIVDGDAISVQELQDATQAYLRAVPGANSGTAQQAILQQMIVGEVIKKAAEEAGVEVSQGEVAAQRDQALSSVREPARAAKISARRYLVRQLGSGEQPTVIPPNQLEEFIRVQLLASKLTADDPEAGNGAILAAADRTDVEMNPRYGRWNPRQGLSPLVSGGLSKTEQELSGTPQQQ